MRGSYPGKRRQHPNRAGGCMNQIRSRHSPDHRPKQKLDHPPSNPQTRTPKLPTTTRGTRSALAHRRPGRGIAPPAHPPPVHMYTEASVRGHEHTCGGDSPAPRLPGAACARGDGRVGLTVDADVVDCRHLCRHCLEQAGSMGVEPPPPLVAPPTTTKGALCLRGRSADHRALHISRG